MNYLDIFLTHNTLLAATLLLIIGFWSYFEKGDDPRNEPLSGLLIASAFWLYAYALWRNAESPAQALFWFKTLFFIASLLPPFLMLLIDAHVHDRPAKAILIRVAFIPNAFLFWMAYFSRHLAT